MKNSTLLKLILTSIFSMLMLVAIQSQITTALVYTVDDDVTLCSGTGQELGDYKSRNFGANGSLEICNFDDNETLMSYFEAWAKFDLTTLEDSIPEGQMLLYAEIELKISNNTGNGIFVYHLKDIDDWKEGNGAHSKLDDTGEGLTWEDAQAFDYENEANYNLIYTNPDVLGTGSPEIFNVTSAVEYEMGAEGNNMLTLRFAPTIYEYDPETSPKKWLGFYTRESPWGVIMPDGVNEAAAHITIWIGPEQPSVFSAIENFGTIDNYNITPTGFQRWAVVEDEGEARLKIMARPAPVNKTPGGLAMYKDQVYGDFDITVKAKLDKWSDEALDPKADFVIPFGYEDGVNYSYMLFTGEDKNGLYLVDTVGAVLVGAGNAVPAITDTAYHDYRLVRSGNTVTAYIDDVEYLTETDDALGTSGMIGMGSYNDIALFDDFLEGEGGELPDAVHNLAQKRFGLYPNPAENSLYINAENEVDKLVIRNIMGQEILNLNDAFSGLREINTSQLETGIYFITLYESTGDSFTSKFLVK